MPSLLVSVTLQQYSSRAPQRFPLRPRGTLHIMYITYARGTSWVDTKPPECTAAVQFPYFLLLVNKL
jgi:hypothetical protein